VPQRRGHGGEGGLLRRQSRKIGNILVIDK